MKAKGGGGYKWAKANDSWKLFKEKKNTKERDSLKSFASHTYMYVLCLSMCVLLPLLFSAAAADKI